MTSELETPEYVVSSGDRVLPIGTVDDRSFDFSKCKTIRGGASVSSATITVEDTAVCTVGSSSVSANIATATFTAVAAGWSLVKCVATTNNSRTIVMVGRIKVVDPFDPTTY